MEEVRAASRIEHEMVTVRIGGEVFALPIEAVEGIIAWEPLTRLPKMPTFIAGLLSVRGSVLPVMDLRKRLGLEISELTTSHRILILQISGMRFGAIVDAVCSVERLAEELIERNIPLAVSIADEFLSGVANRESGMVILLKPSGLLTEQERSDMDRAAQTAARSAKAEPRVPAAA